MLKCEGCSGDQPQNKRQLNGSAPHLCFALETGKSHLKNLALSETNSLLCWFVWYAVGLLFFLFSNYVSICVLTLPNLTPIKKQCQGHQRQQLRWHCGRNAIVKGFLSQIEVHNSGQMAKLIWTFFHKRKFSQWSSALSCFALGSSGRKQTILMK